LKPKFIICDEPVAALDVSIRAQILNLLEEMKARYGLTLLFIAHDLAVVKAVSDRVAVMYLGSVRSARPSNLFANPAHPYTALLIEAIPGRIQMSGRPIACRPASRHRSRRHPAASFAPVVLAPTSAARLRCQSFASWHPANSSPAIIRQSLRSRAFG
jgi:ABC-type oligopeptide transport system ATPase subunit